MFIIGGKTRTREEEPLASKAKITLIPNARSGDSTKEIWKIYKKFSTHFPKWPRFHIKTFQELNSTDPYRALHSAISLLKDSLYFNMSKSHEL